ncbi:hypothetical protein [Mycoplasma miroungirhinis]|uniref:Uncharacterized protein n=1 Tax=Mycoplasma miroungirhinis TaxID=754516 RepID=A0A6M4JI79_9MOLU|nr:hypothetical protein [Mycoplasma miroungirhinis]QJR44171.1 hypothetical protein HLA92_01855 [Mycoplasma miroungirhinis]
MDNTNNELQSKKESKKLKLKIILTVIFSIIFLVIIAVSIAYIADFLIYTGTHKDGLLLSVEQRIHGIFYWF